MVHDFADHLARARTRSAREDFDFRMRKIGGAKVQRRCHSVIV